MAAADVDLYERHAHRELHEPILVLALDGWIDAGGAAAAAAAQLTEADLLPVATFDTDELLDHRARRPVLDIVAGVATELTWPRIIMSALTDDRGRDVLLLHGAEPDHRWKAFVRAVVDLSIELGVTMACGLGAYPAAAPHTRPAALSATASTPELLDRHPFINSTIEVPAGAQAAIEHALDDHGIPSIGLWAQVPHYLSGMPYPEASAALLNGLADVGHRFFDATPLREQGITTRSRIDALVEQNPNHIELVSELEKAFDARSTDSEGELPSGDDLAADFQAFLRDQPD